MKSQNIKFTKLQNKKLEKHKKMAKDFKDLQAQKENKLHSIKGSLKSIIYSTWNPNSPQVSWERTWTGA